MGCVALLLSLYMMLVQELHSTGAHYRTLYVTCRAECILHSLLDIVTRLASSVHLHVRSARHSTHYRVNVPHASHYIVPCMDGTHPHVCNSTYHLRASTWHVTTDVSGVGRRVHDSSLQSAFSSLQSAFSGV